MADKDQVRFQETQNNIVNSVRLEKVPFCKGKEIVQI